MTIINLSMLGKQQLLYGGVSLCTEKSIKDDGICFHGLEPDMSLKMDFLSVVIPFRDNKKLMF